MKKIVCILMLTAGCASISPRRTVNATVTCGDFGQVTSDLGLVNTFGGALGTLVEIDETGKRVFRRLTSQPSEITQPNPTIQSSTLIKGAALSFDLSAKVPEAVEAALKTDINAKTKFVMKNLRRQEIPDPLAEIRNNSRIREAMQERPGELYLYGQAIFTADELRIDLEKSTATGAELSVLKYGKYTVNVSYNCQQSIENISPGGGTMFWKYIQVRFDSTTKMIVLDSRPFDPTKYDWSSR